MSIPGLSVGDLAKQRDARWHKERGVWHYRNPDGSDAVPLYQVVDDAVIGSTCKCSTY
jgi:hypothetical protein